MAVRKSGIVDTRARAGRPPTAQISAAVAYLMQAGYEFSTVIKWMQAQEKSEREDEKPKRKRKRVLFDRYGHKIELYQQDVKRMTK